VQSSLYFRDHAGIAFVFVGAIITTISGNANEANAMLGSANRIILGRMCFMSFPSLSFLRSLKRSFFAGQRIAFDLVNVLHAIAV
jgi:hypothetical protein